MVITKIEAGKYSIVTAGGLKFTVEKRRSHYWVVKGNGLGAVQATLKECKEWAEKQTAKKPTNPATPETIAKTDGPAETVEADDRNEKLALIILDFVDGKVIFNMPTQKVCDLLMNKFAEIGLKWLSGDMAKPGYPNIIDGDECVFYSNDRIARGPKAMFAVKFPSIPIVTLAPADFDRPKKEFTKADLKTGMVVECRNGTRYMVIEGNYECECGGDTDLMLIGEGNSWERGSYYSEGMINSSFANFNIDKVYKRKMQGLGYMLNDISDRDLIWQREPEYDWSKAEVDMPILVKTKDWKHWCNRYFTKYEDGVVFAWGDGKTSWTANGAMNRWDCAVPYKGNEHLVEGEGK